MSAVESRVRSHTLLEAQQRLAELRKLIRLESGRGRPPEVAHGRSKTNTPNFQITSPPILPEHLGWGSEPLTRTFRASRARDAQIPGKGGTGSLLEHRPAEDGPPLSTSPEEVMFQQTATGSLKDPPAEQHIKLYPDIALALLREQLVAPARLWLLLRHLDLAGRGWIDIDEARTKLTKRNASLRVFGWRQMRKLLARGEDLFWTRDARRIWLRSPLKVAVLLGLGRLHDHPVALPVSVLLQGIGLVRAHFYASFHSGRSPADGQKPRSAPIARATLQAICQTSRRTLRQYEKRAGVQSRRNFAIGKPLTVTDLQNQSWQRGRAVLQFTDYAGLVGRKGIVYTAWQLPNSYCGPHEQQPKGRQKRMNRQLADLFMKGMTGNGKQADHFHQAAAGELKRFFRSGVMAATKYNRRPDHDLYWPSCRPNRDRGTTGCQLWHWLPSRESERTEIRPSMARQPLVQ